MKSLRNLLLLLVVIVALVAAGLIESFNLLAAKHRDQVTQELQKVLGQDVSFESLEVNIFGRPGFVATDFRVADDSRFAATPVVRARELVLGVSLWNLLLRRLVITSLTFDQPEFQIITDESGLLNLTALINRKAELRKFPRLRAAGSERKPVSVSFAIDEVGIKNGRVDYIDRSVKQPAELRARNVSMSVKGFRPDEVTRIEIGAALTEGLVQDVRISGDLAPAPENRSWLQRRADLSIQFDSLHVPVVARAIAELRDKIPRELDVTGPMALRVRARGTPERPRLEDITLKIPLFGSSEYNAVITGAVKFTERRSWEEAEIEGRFTVDPFSLTRLRSFAIFEQILPASLVSEGSVRISSRFEGTWETLRVGALVRADKADLRYQDWLHKPAEVPATIRMQISRGKKGFVFHPSELAVGANKLTFAGNLDYQPVPRLRVKLRDQGGSIAAWGRFLTASSIQAVAGKVDLDVTIAKHLSATDPQWSVTGALALHNTALKHRASGRGVDNLHAEVSFGGTKASVKNGRFRLGRSLIFLDGNTADLFQPRLVASVRSPDLVLADLPGLNAPPSVRLKDASGQVEIFFDDQQWTLTGSLAAPQANLNDWPLRDFRADIALQPGGMTVKNIWARTLNGVLRADGFWPGSGAPTRQLQFSSQIDGVDLSALLAQWFLPFRGRLEGQLSGQGHFEVSGNDGVKVRDALKGSGEAFVQRGVIKDFNLASQLLMKGSDSTMSAASMSRLPSGFAALFHRPDTSFESLNANFTIDQRRVFTEDLVLTTPDYTITGAGWVGFDRSTRWNGLLVLSPRLTQEVLRDYRFIRYLLDRRGRLAIGFRIDGQIPEISIRLENRALAQALRSSTTQKSAGADGPAGEGHKEGKNWLPDALERFLKR